MKIKEEIIKKLEVGCLKVTVTCNGWPTMVPKKDGKVRMSVDCRDLNKASPKEFPLPHIFIVYKYRRTCTVLFLGCFLGLYPNLLAPEDCEKTLFITQWGTLSYKVMRCDLKNVVATYQRALKVLFHDMMQMKMEVYVEVMIAKSMAEEDISLTCQRSLSD